MRDILFFVFSIAPWSTIVRKYKSEGRYFFICRFCTPYRKKTPGEKSLFGYVQRVAVEVSAEDFEGYDVGEEYEITTPSAMVIHPQLAVA